MSESKIEDLFGLKLKEVLELDRKKEGWEFLQHIDGDNQIFYSATHKITKRNKSGVMLYQIPMIYREIDDLLFDSEGEVTEEIEALLNQADTDLVTKIENCCHVLRSKESRADFIANEMKRLSGLKKSAEGAVTSLKNYMKRTMEALGKKKVETPLYVVTVRKVADSCKFDGDLKLLPEELIRTKEEFNKSQANALYKALATQRDVIESLSVNIDKLKATLHDTDQLSTDYGAMEQALIEMELEHGNLVLAYRNKFPKEIIPITDRTSLSVK